MAKWGSLIPRIENARFGRILQSLSRTLPLTAVLLMGIHATAAISKGEKPAVAVLWTEPGRPPRYQDACGHLVPCRPTRAVPEPASLLLVGTGLLSIAALVRKRIVR